MKSHQGQGQLQLDTQTPSLLHSLNDQQRQAVTHGTGPLLVVAGAGTGKTTVLTHRIAWLINEGLAKPAEILALTFTEKAAAEMETRVDQLLPYGQTQTTISTFHAFGDSLLREYALDLSLPPEFQVLSTNEQELFLADRFDEIEGLEELRPIGNPRKFIQPILSVISRAKDELVTPSHYREVATQLLADATNEEEEREARRQSDLATIYAAYEEFKANKGVIDFGDQVLKLAQFLDANATVLHRLRAQYRFIVVDEFQDTNIAQYQLVKRLLDSSSNLTVVGDDNQAIYKFRGAAVSNILGFLHDFPQAVQVVLTHNYRSTQAILDGAYRLIRHNDPDSLESKLKISKQLIGQVKGTPPDFRWYAHEADELVSLAESVKQIQTKTPLREIAVLVRSNNLVSSVASSLQAAGITYSASKDQDFVNRPEIRGIMAFLRCLAHTDDSLSCMKLALSPYYQLNPEWVLPFNDAARRARRSLYDVLHDADSVAWKRVPQAGRAVVESFRDDLVRYRSLIGTKNPGEILYGFLKARGILDPYNTQRTLFADMPEQDRLVMIQNIAAVFEAIKGYLDAGRDPFALTFVDQLDDLVLSIVPPSVSLGPDVDAVQVMTVHAAKGLEFDTVLLPSLLTGRFPARRRQEPLGLPDALITETLPSGDEHLQEERRLMYVAMTRAKRALILSGAAKVGSGARTQKTSQFVVEALALTKPPTPLTSLDSVDRLRLFSQAMVGNPPITPSLQLPSYNGVLFLSPAAIECYLQDPYNFYWRYVLKAPQEPSRHLIYGNAIHSAIEAYYRLRKEGRGPTLDDVLQRYSEAWVSEGFHSKVDENRQFEHGQTTLERFMKRADTGPVPEFVESSFKLALPDVKVSGRMDAVFTDGDEIRDFKTSQIKDQKDADRKARENIPIRIYALAYQQQFGHLPKRVVLDFVEHNLEGAIEPNETMLKSTRDLIAETVANIKAGKFDPNPSNPFRDYD